MNKKIYFILFLVLVFLFVRNVNAQSTKLTIRNSDFLKSTVITNPIKIQPLNIHDYLDITVDPAFKDFHKTITIFDILGRVVMTESFDGTEKQITLQDISHGLYFVKVDAPEFTIVSKIEVD
jgi:Secretion system C-terminal sorting domain